MALRAAAGSGPSVAATGATLAVEAVVFDMDGLLLDTETLARRALQLAGGELGIDVPDSFSQLMIGLPAEECRSLLIDRCGPTVSADRFFAASARRLEAQIDEGLLRIKPGAVELLAMLDEAKAPRAVATSSARAKALHHLQATGIDARFDEIVTRDDVRRGKPHPDLFLCAARRLGVAPGRCVALEDSYNGVRAAHAAGMPVIMVPDLLPPTDEMRRLCHAIVDDLHAVAPLLSLRHADSARPAPARCGPSAGERGAAR
jgi:HAD superfamily hydrolase (TIGR01509 family)